MAVAKEKDDDELKFDGSEDGTLIETEEKKEEKTKVEVVVADDTPEEDRRVLQARERKKSKKEDEEGELPALPEKEDDLDAEIAEYGKRSQTRIKQLYGKFHDERRAKEAALRSSEEAVRYAERVVQENKKLNDTLTKGETYLLEQVKKKSEMAVNEAKRKYKEAYESGDAEAITKAMEEMSSAIAEKREVESFKPRDALQSEKKPVQGVEDVGAESDRRAAVRTPAPDPKAVSWANENKWFGTEEDMTAYAYGLHQKLVLRQGVDPRSDDYYEKINSEMRKRFPEKFEERKSSAEGERPRSSAPSKTVVAGVTRAPSSKKVTLTATQAAIARRLGVPLELYAEQVLKESGNA